MSLIHKTESTLPEQTDDACLFPPIAWRRRLRAAVLVWLLVLVPGSAGAVLLFTEVSMEPIVPPPAVFAPLANLAPYQFQLSLLGPPTLPGIFPPAGGVLHTFDPADVLVEMTRGGAPLIVDGVEVDLSQGAAEASITYDFQQSLLGPVLGDLLQFRVDFLHEAFLGFPFSRVGATLEVALLFAPDTLDDSILELPSGLEPLLLGSQLALRLTHEFFACADPSVTPGCPQPVLSEMQLGPVLLEELSSPPAVPEPASLWLVLLGVVGSRLRWRKRGWRD